MKTALIILSAVAVVLGTITFFVVFYPTGSYAPVAVRNPNPPTSLASSTSTSTATSTPTGDVFASDYPPPYPVAWTEGHETFSITGADLRKNVLRLTLAIQMGNVPECVPLSLQLITDETGAFKAPDSPVNAVFAFPDTQSCNGRPGAAYSEPVAFSVDPASAPFTLTTGGTANIFFQVATTSAGGVEITLPSQSG